jgi:hypothetical protein
MDVEPALRLPRLSMLIFEMMALPHGHLGGPRYGSSYIYGIVFEMKGLRRLRCWSSGKRGEPGQS